MPLRDTLRELVVTQAARFRAGPLTSDGDDEVSVRLDDTRDPPELVVEDETNGVEQVRLPLGNDLATTLSENGENEIPQGDLTRQRPVDHTNRHEQGGPDEIAEGQLTRQNPTDHASRHSNGGTDELDAADLSGSSGSSGDFLATTGSSAYWDDPPSAPPYTQYESVESGYMTVIDIDANDYGDFTESVSLDAVTADEIQIDGSGRTEYESVYVEDITGGVLVDETLDAASSFSEAFPESEVALVEVEGNISSSWDVTYPVDLHVIALPNHRHGI